MDTILWIVLVLVALMGVAALVMRMSRGRQAEARRGEAEAIRDEAREQDRDLREREAHAEEVEARARQARAEAEAREAEAQRQEAEAKRLEAEAERRGEHAEAARTQRDEHLRRADARDPDVLTDDEGYRVDEHGNRLEGQENADDRWAPGPESTSEPAGAAWVRKHPDADHATDEEHPPRP